MTRSLLSRWTLPLVAVAGVAAGALAMLGFDRSVGDRARTETIVRDYVLTHPELIPEAMQRLQDKETGSRVADNRRAILEPVGSAWAGNPKGDVTVVEYFDYNCGYCRASLPEIAKLIAADPKVRIVYRELPVLAETSRDAARASLAAARQGKFATFHDALYAAGPVTPAAIAATARRVGVDLSDAASAANDAEIASNLKVAGTLGMTGTPSWVIGNRVLSGALPMETLQKAIADARNG